MKSAYLGWLVNTVVLRHGKRCEADGDVAPLIYPSYPMKDGNPAGMDSVQIGSIVSGMPHEHRCEQTSGVRKTGIGRKVQVDVRRCDNL